jgi:hypothetical protein
MASVGNRGRNHSRRRNEVRGHKVLRKQSKAHDKKLAELDAEEINLLMEEVTTVEVVVQLPEIEKAPDNRSLFQRISFGISHRKIGFKS